MKSKAIKSHKKEIPKKESSLFEKLERKCVENEYILISIILFLSILFSFLLFDIKISTGYDDAEYIQAANSFANNFTGYFYSIKGPLYPMILSVAIRFVGINVPVLKIISVLFFILSIYFTYRAFRNRIPFLILFLILLMVGSNSYFQFYASMTYSETLFLLIQSLFFYTFFKLYDQLKADQSLAITWKNWLMLSFILLLMHLTRNVGIGALITVVFFFLINRQFKNVMYLIASAGIFEMLFLLIKNIIWGGINQFSTQANSIFYKDPYNIASGKEDFQGMVNRFFANIDIYFSSRLWEILGFKKDFSPNSAISVFTILAIIVGLIFIIRNKNHYLLLSTIYIFIMTSITFVAVSAQWAQERLIMIYIPFILLALFYGFYKIFSIENFKSMQYLWILGIFIFLYCNFKSTAVKTFNNVGVLKHNLKGESLYGYTNDWANYLSLSKWSAENLPDSALVACRKAPMSFIYSNGKAFYGIGRGPQPNSNADTLLWQLKKAKVSHVILANLRKNPKKANGEIINTLQRYFYPIVKQYPTALKELHREGRIEEAVLFEIQYPANMK